MPRLTAAGRYSMASCAAISLLLCARAASAQSVGSTPHESAPAASAIPLRGEIAVDGRLDEPIWAAAPPVTAFRQVDPEEGEPVSERTDVRIVYGPDAIYVGAFLHDSYPVTSRLVRRDAIALDSDWFTAAFDSYHDHLTAFRFSVNPAGVRRDEVFSSGGRSGTGAIGTKTEERGGAVDQSWEPIWTAAATVTDSGWVAELRIPFSQLRFSGTEEQRWGLQLERRIARRQEQALFAFTPKDDATGVGRYGHLTGLEGIRASQRLEILPYLSGRLLRRPLRAAPSGIGFENPYLSPTEFGGGVGADVKYRLSSNFTLNATLNPDFGQVELDPAVLNLTAFETRYDEKRPFFVEGADIMRFGTTTLGAPEGGPPTLMYSRRVGRAPQLGLPGDAVYSDSPEVTTILGAAKLTGRAAGGWSIGLLEAVTQRETAGLIVADGGEREALVEPLSSYFAGRIRRDLDGGRSTVGAMATAVNRDLGSGGSAQLRDGAYALGMDFRSETADRVWSAFGTFSSSYITGSPEAIAAAQRSSARYLQRPDAKRLSYDPTATSLAGYRAQVDAGKRAGSWLWNVALTASSPGYEVNDFGFQTSTDRLVLDPNLDYVQNHPSAYLRKWSVRFGPDFVWNYDGDLVRQQSYFTIRTQFLNYWTANLQLNHSEPVMNDRLTRGGPLTLSPAANAGKLEILSDPRRKFTANALVNLGMDRAGMRSRSLSFDVGVKPAENWVIEVGPELTRTELPAQYVTTVTDATAASTLGRRYIFAGLDQTTLALETRLNVTFTPDLTLELYAQPFVASNQFGALKELRTPRTFDFDVYGQDVGSATPHDDGWVLIDPDGAGPAKSFRVEDGDFDLASLRGNAVLRWEWRPGSTFYLVWQQERYETLAARETDFDFGRNVGDIFDVRPTNVLLFKVSYWLNP